MDRSTIRDKIVQCFADELSESETADILNLNLIPQAKKLYFSISHSPAGSGFAAFKRPVGLDIEKRERTQNLDLIQRISQKHEQDLLGPHSFLIWSLKESAFKSLSPQDSKLKTISQIHIDNVKSVQSNSLTAQVSFKEHAIHCQCQWDDQRVVCLSYL